MKAGGLFLGRTVDVPSGKTGTGPLLLDPDDLTTHGLIVGMTGSGKTALGIVLIEELLTRGVPVLAVDPKGDLGNLLLTFPGLAPDEFAPYLDASSGTTAVNEAARWRDGLAGWGLGAKDVAELAASREARIYTPGSTAGTPLDLFGSCAPPPKEADDEDRRDLVTAFVSGLLGLAGIDADPVKSRPFIFLSQCVQSIWDTGSTATLEALLRAVSSPGFSTVGALPLGTFFPAKERQDLVLALNSLLASPSSVAFRMGEPIDAGMMLGKTATGLPRLSVVSIAHLSDPERLFVVSTLLTRVKAWMRGQPGSSSLRALVYIDEIFGFFPPSAEPPTKRPLLTLLKQARAFGIGVVLATQNPVDLDYKGLANCGCWFVGTLQTERDKKRLSEGLSEAGGSGAEGLLDKTRKRVFLLHDVHRKEPVLFESRWAMSWLRGPMTREDIARAAGAAPAPQAKAREPGPAAGSTPPPVPSPWTARWATLRSAEIASPNLYVKFAVRYRFETAAAPETTGVKLFPFSGPSPGEVLEADATDLAPEKLLDAAPSRALRYAELPGWLGPAAVKIIERTVRDRLPDKLAAKLLRDPVTGALSMAAETPEAFSTRLAGSSEPPAALREKLERKRRELASAESQEESRTMETIATGVGAAVDLLGGLLGKRKSLRISKVSSVLTKRRMEGTASSKVETLKAEIAELESRIAPPDPSRFTRVDIVPAKAHVDILAIGVAWVV